MGARMKTLSLDLENCYGIKKLKTIFDFTQSRSYAIYAPNGSMKSCLAQTFSDVANAAPSQDRIFPSRPCQRWIKNDAGADIPRETVFVIRPYDQELGHTEKTSTLLVDAKLRQEYERLHADIDKSKELFLKTLKEQSGSKKDLEKEISTTFTRDDDAFYRALLRVKDELLEQKDAPFADVNYDTIFDDKVIAVLGTKDFKTAIQEYIRKYNELLAASTYFKKGIFNYYNAALIAKHLADNGFFAAKHTVSLNADSKLEITTQKQLEELIAKEKEGISKDKELRKKFAEIEKVLTKNATVRDFEAYLAQHEDLLPKLSNIESFKEEIWKSYFKARFELYKDLVEKYQAVEKRKREIEEIAGKQRTQWEAVIEIFNKRFFVPFKLSARNRVPVILGQEPMLSLGFTFEDGTDKADIERDTLMRVLSTGEKKALYILNIIFEVEARKKANQETIFIVDDIADSFDYKNKYAIIQYLKDIEETPFFYEIILTHNFDFFRTVNSRFVAYSHCLMATRSSAGLVLQQASGIKNVFVNDWKLKFFTDTRKKVASIPFIRNIIEYTKGDSDPEYMKMTSLLHWKKDSAFLPLHDLDSIYNALFGGNGTSANGNMPVVDLIHKEAAECAKMVAGGINLENKVVLSIAIRLAAERFMVEKINDPVFVAGITSDQTPKLLSKFRELFPADVAPVDVVQRVILMTPENIHLNSFMYEPILDMSDEHLKKLYEDVLVLK